VSGTSDRINWLRGDDGTFCKLNKEQIKYSIEASLIRLETEFIDLLKIHCSDIAGLKILVWSSFISGFYFLTIVVYCCCCSLTKY